MPFTLEEYRRGQLYTTNQESQENTDGDSAVQIMANEPFDNERGRGQYTHKLMHCGSKLPKFVDMLLPNAYKIMDEVSWNMFPHCRTEYTHQKFQGTAMIIETMHVADDIGKQDNVFNLPAKDLKSRIVVNLNLATDRVANPKPNRDASVSKSEKTGRGPLVGDWAQLGKGYPMMCAYKLVTIKLNSYMLWPAEGYIKDFARDLMLSFNQYVFCLLDKWIDLTMDDIRRIEHEFKEEADRIIKATHIREHERPPSSVHSAPAIN